MSIFDGLFRKTRTVKFEKDPPGEWITLETPEGMTDSFDQEDILECIRRITEDPDFYLILTLPVATHGIRYVQACECHGIVDVQLAVEKKKHVRLVEKLCSAQECADIFLHFFDTGEVDDLRTFKPVRFERSQA